MKNKILYSVMILVLIISISCVGCKNDENKGNDMQNKEQPQDIQNQNDISSNKNETSSEKNDISSDNNETSSKKNDTSLLSNDKNNNNKKQNDFYIKEIDDELFNKIKGKSYKDDCIVPRADLRYLHILHKTLDGKTKEGEMITNYHIANEILSIFKELYEQNYPIEHVRLIDNYDADDEKSMEDNNSSSFNFRKISYSSKLSKHAYGLAVDINPLYNPYIKKVDGKESVEPINATKYVDRTKEYPYKITTSDLCYKLFKKHGFEWGGLWNNSKDYQHFQVSNETLEKWYPNK